LKIKVEKHCWHRVHFDDILDSPFLDLYRPKRISDSLASQEMMSTESSFMALRQVSGLMKLGAMVGSPVAS